MKIEVEIGDRATEVLVISMGAMMTAADGLETKALTVQGMGLEAAAERWYQASKVVRAFEYALRAEFTELSEGSSMGTPL